MKFTIQEKTLLEHDAAIRELQRKYNTLHDVLLKVIDNNERMDRSIDLLLDKVLDGRE
jgi:hypothetical protein